MKKAILAALIAQAVSMGAQAAPTTVTNPGSITNNVTTDGTDVSADSNIVFDGSNTGPQTITDSYFVSSGRVVSMNRAGTGDNAATFSGSTIVALGADAGLILQPYSLTVPQVQDSEYHVSNSTIINKGTGAAISIGKDRTGAYTTTATLDNVTASAVGGSALYSESSVTVNNSTITSGYAAVYLSAPGVSGDNNSVFNNTTITNTTGGDALFFNGSPDGGGNKTTATLNNSEIDGNINVFSHPSSTSYEGTATFNNSVWKGSSSVSTNDVGGSSLVNINLNDNSVWTNTADSSVTSLSMTNGATIIMDSGNITAGTLTGNVPADSAATRADAAPVTILSTYNPTTSAAYLLTAGTATGTFQAGVTSGSSGDAGDMTGNAIVHVTDGSGATFNAMQTDAGVYRYTSRQVVNADGSTDVVLDTYTADPADPAPTAPTLSTAAQSVVNTRAAGMNLWRDEEDALNLRMDNERRTGDNANGYGLSAWGSYFGGNHRQKMDGASTSFDQTNNGFMVGGDKRIAVDNGNLLVGFAANRGWGNVNMHDMGSAGTDIDSYGLSIYASYRMNNGLFFDATIKGDHMKNDMDVISTDGGHSKGDYSTNGFGGSLKAGYHWAASDAFWAEPYAKVSYARYNGVDYTLDNGMQAKDDNYTSLRLEGGANIGTTIAMGQTEVKPYLHLAVAGETENGNTMKINGVSLDDSADGARGIVGLGTDVKFTKSLGAYAGATYSKGQDMEDPWQLNAGISYTW